MKKLLQQIIIYFQILIKYQSENALKSQNALNSFNALKYVFGQSQKQSLNLLNY